MRQTQAGASGSLYDLVYEYSLFGSLTKATDNTRSVREQYTYDRLHRLKTNTRYMGSTAQTPVSYVYDVLGSIQSKSDFGSTYSYNKNAPVSCTGGGQVAAGPSAVTSVVTPAGTRLYSYDANGNLICSNAADGSLSALYDAFNLPLSMCSEWHSKP